MSGPYEPEGAVLEKLPEVQKSGKANRLLMRTAMVLRDPGWRSWVRRSESRCPAQVDSYSANIGKARKYILVD